MLRVRPSFAAMSSVVLCFCFVPAAVAQQAPDPVTFVRGAVVEVYAHEAYTGAREGSRDDIRGYLVESAGAGLTRQVVEWDDPRLPTDLWLTRDFTVVFKPTDDPDAVSNHAWSVLLQDAEGRWRGTGRSVSDADGSHSLYALAGEGAYEGLSAILRGVPADGLTWLPEDMAYSGYIFEAELTPFPDDPIPVSTGAWRVYPPPGLPADG
jgi:hypothetical protein